MKKIDMRDDDRLLRQLESERRSGEPGTRAGSAPAAPRLDPRLDARLDAWRAIASDLGALGTESFGPAFRGQLLERIRAGVGQGETALYGQLRWMFARVAVAGVAAALVLGAYNVSGGYETTGTLVDSVFGLPSADLEAAIMLAGDAR